MTANRRGPWAALFLMAAVGVMGGWAAIGQERGPDPNQRISGPNQGISGQNQGVSGQNQGVSGQNQGVSGEKTGLARPGAALAASPDALRLDSELDSDVRRMLEEYAAASNDGAKADLRVRLKEAASKQFDLRQRTRQAELDELEEELKRLRAIHERREDAKDAIVETRLRQLIDAAEGLGWDVSGSDAASGSNPLLDPFAEGGFFPVGRPSAAPSAAGPLAAPPAATVPRVRH